MKVKTSFAERCKEDKELLFKMLDAEKLDNIANLVGTIVNISKAPSK